MQKVRVSIFIGHFMPGWRAGGPIRTVLEMIKTAPDDAEITVVTSDRDLGDKHRYPGLTNDKHYIDTAQIVYVNWGSPRDFISKIIAEVRRRPQIIILNSFFDARSSLSPILLSSLKLFKGQLALGPRGEFSSGALEIKSTKKHAYIRVMGLLPSVRTALWIATSHLEEQDIRRHFPRARVVVVPDSPGTKPADVVQPAADAVNLVFLSRISPKKNLTGALRALLAYRSASKLQFDIYGTIEDPNYWSECKQIIELLPAEVCVEYKGEVPPDQTTAVFAQYDAFLFPTRGENFGHVIHEALSQGCPVFLSETTPWSDLIRNGAGFLCHDEADLSNEINRLAEETTADRTRRKLSAHSLYTQWWRQSAATSKPPLELIFSSALN